MSGAATGTLVMVALLATAGCGSRSTVQTSTSAEAITIDIAWTRPTPAKATAAAVYARVANASGHADAITYVKVPSGIAAGATLNTPSPATGTNRASPSSPTVGMKAVEQIPVPAGGSVRLVPGGYEVLMLGLDRRLTAGDSFQAVFGFASGIVQTVRVKVRVQ
jgi:copper(I)-binding protein